MAQKNRFLKSAGFGLMLSTMAFSVSSCIDSLYDLSKGISMDMELGGDSLAIPIGSTDTIKLGDYLDASTISMLKTMEDGGYAITKKDSLEPEIPIIDQSKLKIGDQTKKSDQTIDFGKINLDAFKIPGINIDKEVNLPFGSYSINSFTIPSITSSAPPTEVVMSKYALSTLNISPISVNADMNGIFSNINVPNYTGDPKILPVDDKAVQIDKTTPINNSVSVPAGVKNISDVEMESGEFVVTLELEKASDVLNYASLIPEFTIDTKGLFEFEEQPGDATITFSKKDSLYGGAGGNNYKITKTLHIKKLNIDGNPNASNLLEISKDLTTKGQMTLSNASISSDKVSRAGEINMLVKIEVKNMGIKSMAFDIPPLDFAIEKKSTSLTINNAIPEQITKLNKVYFDGNSKIRINLGTADLPEMESTNITIDSLVIEFPEQFVLKPMAGLSNNIYTIRNEAFDPNIGKTIELTLESLDMSNIPINSIKRLVWDGLINYSAKVAFKGRMNSRDLSATTKNAKMNVSFSSAITFQSADVTTNQIDVNIPTLKIPIDLDIDIATQVKRLGEIKMKPGTQIRLDIQKPTFPLTFEANYIQVTFPNIFAFDPPLPLNTLILDGALKDSVILVIDALKINQDLINGKYVLHDSIKMSGGVKLLPKTINSTEINDLSGKKMNVNVSSSDMGISKTDIQLNDLAFNYGDSLALDFDINSVPTQLISLDSVLLKDSATIKLAVDITNMPNFKSDLNVDLVIDFPDMFLFKPGSVNSKNQLIIHEAIVDGKLNKTIGIHGLKFDGKDLNGKLSIHQKLKYTAGISVVAPTVNSDELVGKIININVEATIRNIAFKSVYGKLDPGLEPINQEISLGDISKTLEENNLNVTLDITKPVIAINTECNLGIPIDAYVKVMPIRGGNLVSADEQDFMLKLPKAPTPQDIIKKTFWISPDSAGMPTGSDFIQTNVQNLFKKVPDGIKLVATINADKTMQHYFDLSATYKFKLGYEVTIPLAFGEELSIGMQKDITGIDPKIGEMASAVKGIELLGTIQNSIPLELELAVIPLDADGKAIAVDTVKQIISAGAHDGSAVSSALALKLADPEGLLKELRGFRLIFKASSNETVAGTPIKPSNFVKADLKVRVDGGINIGKLTNN